MAVTQTTDQTLQARLAADMARRLRYPWVMYVFFCAAFALETDFGGAHPVAAWGFVLAMLLTGLLRFWSGERTANLADSGPARIRAVFLWLVALHSLLWGCFVASALWSVNGNALSEMCIGLGVAGFATSGAVVLSPYRPIAFLNLMAQCVPLLFWAVLQRGRLGVLVYTLVIAFVIFISFLIRANHQHILMMFRAQLLLEIRGEELRRAKEAAEEASSARAQFLANMSHEIRTPLHGVLGLTQVLGDTTLTGAQTELLTALTRSGNHLLSIVNDVLDCSKIASGRLTLETVPFDLKLLVDDVAAPAAAIAQAKGLRWVVEGETEIRGAYRGDPVRIRQVLTNLLSNAVKFTESGEVKLRVEAERSGGVRFVVADTGIGISESQLRDLFQDFSQADASTTRRFGGTGLGLAITKRLLELMGGQLSVESRLGAGARFTASVPLPSVKAENADRASMSVKSEAPQPCRLAGLRVLLAEDNPVNRMIAERFLLSTGCMVDTAETGRIAVARHSAQPYDLILMDCHMPDMDGFEATAAIRALKHGAEVPVLAVTASAFAEDRENCLRSGMNGYVAKPLRREDLFQAIAAVLQGREAPVRAEA